MIQLGSILEIYFAVVAALLLFLISPQAVEAADSASQETRIPGYDYKGAYAQLGAAVGGDEGDAFGGFTTTGGYRMAPSLSIEGNVTFIAGSNDETYLITVGPKVYPLGMLSLQTIPESIQPYAVATIGVGDENFAGRFLLGVDYWMTARVGLFAEGGGLVIREAGAGIFAVGGQYRF